MSDLEISGMALKSFVLTQEFKRFEEFAVSCADFRYIGICHGEPGVGKSLAALQYTQWKEEFTRKIVTEDVDAQTKTLIDSCKGALVTVPVTNTPKIIKNEIYIRTFMYGVIKIKSTGERDPTKCLTNAVSQCPLVILDEADRLNLNALEEVRSLYDQYRFGLILIGMTGIEKRFSRYPQLYSRIGFGHEFKRLSEDEMQFLFPKIWSNLGIDYNPKYFSDVEALNSMVRITAGNFRLIDRLFNQIIRIIKINKLKTINKEVVEAARKCLIIGNR